MATLGEGLIRQAPRYRQAVAVWLALAAAALAAIVFALAAGSGGLSFAELAPGAEGSDIVWQLRWPRTMAAFAVGALLAVAGALMQILLRNPLADPYVLGLSGGAAVGALLAMLASLPALAVSAGAAAGAAASVLLVFGLARRDLASAARVVVDPSPRLLLTGVILAAGWGALITLILTFSPDVKLRGMLFWLMGDLNGVDSWLPAIGVLAVALAIVFPLARDLNVVLRGETLAEALGVPVKRLTLIVFAVASVATAAAVTTAGTIGFVGLIVPHALRLAIGNDQRVLIPAAALAGGTLLVAADALARTVVAPIQLPVGMIMALAGVPAFIALMYGKSR